MQKNVLSYPLSAVALGLMAVSSGAISGPVVGDGAISWSDDGWYQVQRADDYATVCEGGLSCEVEPGSYIVINHTTGERYDDIKVAGDSEIPLVIVSGNTISWQGDGWYQVLDAESYAHVCEGGQSCAVDDGVYIVINHTTGQRFENVEVSAGSEPSSGSGSGTSEASEVTVTGNTITWSTDDWYQVQSSSDYATLCEGGSECVVPDGTYFVINLSTGERFENIVVAADGAGSGDDTDTDSEYSDTDFEVTDWTEETHSNDVDPNFEEVFNDAEVKRLDFVVTAERWQSMLDDMTSLYGEFGVSAGGAAGGPGAGGPPLEGGPGAGEPRPEGEPGAAGADGEDGGQALIETDEDPIFVPADVYYNGKQWYRAGIRFKGNSTLQGSWQSGILKLSFKMDFDEFEDEYPQIDNQRFYGFKKFSLKNNYLDKSQLREKVASDVFRKAGLAASHTAFYTLYVDHGNGPEYFGLYTLVEEVDGSVIDTQFSSDDGNLYKPEDGSANFVAGSFNAEDFEKKTNEDDADWSDIIAMFDALHDDDTASTDPAAWRENLEAVFDVDGFLKYLAVNGIIQNWDTYGRMPHNYYLYNDPDSNKLTWIPWDNNEALQEGNQGGALALDFSNLSAEEWPLIAKIYADDTYKARYNYYLSEVMADAFETSSIKATYDNYSALVQPYATTELPGFSFLSNASDFSNDIISLKTHAADRAAAVSTYLSGQ